MRKIKKFKKRSIRRVKRRRGTVSRFIGKIAARKFTSDIVVYSIITNGSNTAPYSLSNGSVVLALSMGWDAIPLVYNMVQSYQMFKLTGVKLCFRRSFPENIPTIDGVNFLAFYPMSFNLDYHDPISGVAGSNISLFETDGNMKVQTINEDSKPISAYWSLPHIPQQYGATSGGIWNCWQDLMSSNGNQSFYVTLGYPAIPLLNGNASSSGAFPIGVISVTYYTKFMHPQVSFQQL